MLHTTIWQSPLGGILLAEEDGALCGLWFRGQKYEGAGLPAGIVRWLTRYFAQERPERDFPLAPKGTAFQKRVWRALEEIPMGETRSYGEIAAQLGCASARAVGAAVGRNPISLIIPCHRVLGADGSLTGYAGGRDRKRALLRLEGRTEKGEAT